MTGHARCIKQLALTVGTNVKFRSSQPKDVQYIAKSVTRNIRNID